MGTFFAAPLSLARPPPFFGTLGRAAALVRAAAARAAAPALASAAAAA